MADRRDGHGLLGAEYDRVRRELTLEPPQEPLPDTLARFDIILAHHDRFLARLEKHLRREQR
jgi:hypothetical protein